MLHKGDLISLFLLILLLLYLLKRSFRKALINPVVLESNRRIQGEVPDLLRDNGYEVVAAKQRLPIQVHVGEQTFDSRIYADFIARQNNDHYVVIVAKARKPLRLSGATVRDQFLAHVLAFQAAGVLFVEPDRKTLQSITFHVAGVREPRQRRYLPHLLTMGLGALIAILIK